MPDFLDLIKKAATGAVRAEKPVSFYTGEIIALSPITVRLSQKLTLSGQQLIVASAAANADIGDTVIVARQQGGSRYIIIDKVVTV